MDTQTVRATASVPATRGFAPLPERWIAEQVYGTLMRHRHLVRDYEPRRPLTKLPLTALPRPEPEVAKAAAEAVAAVVPLRRDGHTRHQKRLRRGCSPSTEALESGGGSGI
ncbi:hypothetical protein [Actinomadura formosensis]|uniref:hypothetical protein n=1 Tax=Actinomadura formosensis TaxID=60706 RepID=UPI0010413DBE|nr:hypothetical protein [Actinomadura formosensis]